MSKIFVFVPTLKDSEYVPTVKRMLERASNPDNINIGTTIFWKQEDVKTENAPFFYEIEKELKNIKNVRYDIMSFAESPGVGGGRTQTLKHYDGEKYCLSIDPHTYFENNWDERLIELYHESEKDFGKRRLLTTYLPHFSLPGETFSDVGTYVDQDGFTLSGNNKWPYFTFEWSTYPQLTKNYIFPLPSDKTVPDSSHIFDNMIMGKFLPAKKINANFNFTEADPWITDFGICLSPLINFWGEEFFQSALAYARGYQFVFPIERLMWHLYSSSVTVSVNTDDGTIKNESKIMDRGKDFKVLDFDNPQERIEYLTKHVMGKKSINNGVMDDNNLVLNLLKNNLTFNYLPRSFNGFLKYSGIDLINRTTSPWDEVPKLDVIYK